MEDQTTIHHRTLHDDITDNHRHHLCFSRFDADCEMDCSYRASLREELASETLFSRLQLKRELFPERELFRNIRSLTLDEWDCFHLSTGEFEISDDAADDSKDPGKNQKKKRKIHTPR